MLQENFCLLNKKTHYNKLLRKFKYCLLDIFYGSIGISWNIWCQNQLNQDMWKMNKASHIRFISFLRDYITYILDTNYQSVNVCNLANLVKKIKSYT